VLELAASQFDYGAISPSLVSCLQAQAKLIKNMIARTTAAIIEIGNHLRAVKEHHLVEHGQFIDWVESEVGIVKRTAQSYMAIARLAETKSATVALLPPTTAHRLAAISAPVEVVDYVIAKANDDVIVPDGEVVAMIREANWKRREAKKKEHASYRRSKTARKKEELRQLEREHERKNRQEAAARAASDLIQALGRTGATKVVEVLSADMMFDVLKELKKQLSSERLP